MLLPQRERTKTGHVKSSLLKGLPDGQDHMHACSTWLAVWILDACTYYDNVAQHGVLILANQVDLGMLPSFTRTSDTGHACVHVMVNQMLWYLLTSIT